MTVGTNDNCEHTGLRPSSVLFKRTPDLSHWKSWPLLDVQPRPVHDDPVLSAVVANRHAERACYHTTTASRPCPYSLQSWFCSSIQFVSPLSVLLVVTKLFHTSVSMTTSAKKHFRPGGMAASEWMSPVRAIRDTPVAHYSAPRPNKMRRVADHPPIAVSLFLLALSVYYWKRALWRCAQLWPYVGMGSSGTSAKGSSVWKPHAGFHKHEAFPLSYSSLLQSHD